MRLQKVKEKSGGVVDVRGAQGARDVLPGIDKGAKRCYLYRNE